jgi:hypothetical protein
MLVFHSCFACDCAVQQPHQEQGVISSGPNPNDLEVQCELEMFNLQAGANCQFMMWVAVLEEMAVHVQTYLQ